MRETIRDKGRLEHILLNIGYVEQFSAGKTCEDLQNDKLLLFGIVKAVEIVGEAVYMLTKEFKNSHPEVPWLVIEKMRHVLVHGYYTIRPEKIWETIQTDLPELKGIIKQYLIEMKDQ